MSWGKGDESLTFVALETSLHLLVHIIDLQNVMGLGLGTNTYLTLPDEVDYQTPDTRY